MATMALVTRQYVGFKYKAKETKTYIEPKTYKK